jgi:hypothetical protein
MAPIASEIHPIKYEITLRPYQIEEKNVAPTGDTANATDRRKNKPEAVIRPKGLW